MLALLDKLMDLRVKCENYEDRHSDWCHSPGAFAFDLADFPSDSFDHD